MFRLRARGVHAWREIENSLHCLHGSDKTCCLVHRSNRWGDLRPNLRPQVFCRLPQELGRINYAIHHTACCSGVALAQRRVAIIVSICVSSLAQPLRLDWVCSYMRVRVGVRSSILDSVLDILHHLVQQVWRRIADALGRIYKPNSNSPNSFLAWVT